MSLKEPYLEGIRYITALQWPALISLAVLAHPIVNILLGSQWQATVPIIQIVAPALLVSFSFALNFPLLVAIGAMREVFVLALALWPASTVILSLVALWGVKALVFSLYFVLPVHAGVSMNAVRKHIAFNWSDIAVAIAPSAIITAVTILGPLSVVAYARSFELSIAEGLAAGALAAPCWLMALWLTGHPLLNELTRAARSRR